MRLRILVTSCIIPPVTACFQNLRFCSVGDCFFKQNYNYKDLFKKNQPNKQTNKPNLTQTVIIKICLKKTNQTNKQT